VIPEPVQDNTTETPTKRHTATTFLSPRYSSALEYWQSRPENISGYKSNTWEFKKVDGGVMYDLVTMGTPNEPVIM
jgi:hypothetical protein